MFKYLLQGFLLGIAYVAPIGMQNLYVINTAATKSKFRAYQAALITAFFDISLALACFFGVGAIIEASQVLRIVILFIGSLAVMYIGVQLIKSMPGTIEEINVNKSILQIITACFLVTWANPQALIDGSLLLGGFKASLNLEASRIFIMGVCIASLSWFLCITTIVSIFKNVFNIKVLRAINIVCGAIIVLYGLKLAYSFICIIG